MNRILAYLYKIAYPIAKIYWFFRRPVTEGVRCMVINDNNILLIRHTYGSGMKTTVGGGMGKKETPLQAVFREVREEVGISLSEATKIGEVKHEQEYKKDTIHVFIAETTETNLETNSAEILEAAWHPLHNLPSDISPLFKKFFALAKPYLEEKLEQR